MVVLKALIDTNGDVKEFSLVSGHPLLAPAALEAVKQWKYQPYLLNSQPVKVETQITVNFQLSPYSSSVEMAAEGNADQPTQTAKMVLGASNPVES